MAEVVVIGIGNTDRGDDGVGRAVAKHLAARQIRNAEILEAGGEATELLTFFEKARAVWLVDACQTGKAAGWVHRFDLAKHALPEKKQDTSTHGFGVGQAVELARALGTLPPICILYAVEAGQFSVGAGLSTSVAEAAIVVAEAIATDIVAFNPSTSRSA